MKPIRLVTLASVLVLAACTSSTPTGPELRDAVPSYDGGVTVGSGNGTMDDGGIGTTTTTTDTTTNRGPGMMGSGN